MEQLQDNLEEHDRLQEQIGGLWFCCNGVNMMYFSPCLGPSIWLWPLTSHFTHSAIPNMQSNVSWNYTSLARDDIAVIDILAWMKGTIMIIS